MGHLYRNVWDNITFLYDYGEGAPTRVPGTDRYRKPRLFAMTLWYSRRSTNL